MLSKVLKYHVVPLMIAVGLAFLLISVLSNYRPKSENQKLTIEGSSTKIRGFHANLTHGEQSEINFLASISDPSQLTLFGSSEFSESPYASYYFLPDSVGMKAMGIGHAYHQNFSIYAECLAAEEYITESNICIIVSPTWFGTNGTNTEAFIEFVRPNLLNAIATNDNLTLQDKAYIGKYINENKKNLSGISDDMLVLEDIYLSQFNNPIQTLNKSIQNKTEGVRLVDEITYKFSILDTTLTLKQNIDFVAKGVAIKDSFLSKITNNSMFIYDDYYTSYVLKENGEEKSSFLEVRNEYELNDFRMLLNFLKSKKVNCSFVIQPVNPYFYKEIENLRETLTTVKSLINEKGYPILDLFVYTKEDYDPATLKDVQHLGDYGWMKINKFLFDTYGKQYE